MTIEQEFFEAFGISKKQRCSLDGDNCPFGFSHLCSECDVDDVMVYPPITPEIVLALIKLLTNAKGFSINRLENFNDKYVYAASINHKDEHVYGVMDSFETTILSLCIFLKHELQSEVLTLFSK